MPSTAFPRRVRSARLAELLRGQHVVCGYRALLRNPRDPEQPLVSVVFRRLEPDGSFGSFRTADVSLISLGHYRYGDVVEDGRSVRQLEFASHCFRVDFPAGRWCFKRASTLAPYPPGHWLHDFSPRGWMAVFRLPSSRTLWVPCLELFSRCYGRSQALKRVLATYEWSRAWESLLPSPGEPSTPERPVVRIVPPLVEDDAFFLASLRHCPYTQRAAREIYSQLDQAYPSSASTGAFLKVGPWFEGPAALVVEGERLPGSGVFLAHRIAGGSLPPGPDVVAVRGRDARDGASPGSPSLEPGAPLSPRHVAPDPVEMTSDTPPGRGAGHVEVRDEDFVVVGQRRRVTVKPVPREPGERRLPGPDVPAPDQWAAGDATGSDPSVGEARIDAPTLHQSDGLLLGLWNGLSALADRHSRLDSVEWYTFQRGFQPAGPPELLRFRPYDALERRRRRWMWLDPKVRPPRRPRGLLVLRCVVDGRVGYVADIQRRRDEPGKTPERFSMLVFTLPSEDQLAAWLGQLLPLVRDARGVFAGVLDKCPGPAAVFHHPRRDSKKFSELAACHVLSELRGLLWPQG